MTKDEATELIERIPYIGTANMPGSKERIEFYRKVISQRDPVMWIKVIKTGYICKNKRSARDDARFGKQLYRAGKDAAAQRTRSSA